ncbi:MAG: PspA/IM30 family protein [Hyphomicrobiaceae bacterium]
MSIWMKLVTAVRGGANEAAEAVADNQAMRILDQEMRDAENALRKARSDLAGLMANGKRMEKRVNELNEKSERDMENARAAVTAGRQDLAEGLASRVANTRAELERDTADLERLWAQQQSMTQTIRQTESRIATMKREIESVRATESLQKAQSAIAATQSGVNSRLGSAMGSLERIKQRQEKTAAQIEAGEELAAMESGSDLDRQLLEAGIGGQVSSTDSIMAEIMGGAAPQKLEAVDSPALPSPEKK